MRSKWMIESLGKYISQQNIRNSILNKYEVYSVTNSGGFIKSTDYFTKEVFSKNLTTYKIVKRNQFAYNPSRINVGSIACLSETDFALVSPLYIIFEVNQNYLFPAYLLRYLKSHYGIVQIRKNTEGSVRDSLKYKGLENIKIPLPPIEDQIRISIVLTRVEALIAKRKENIKVLDEYLKSIFLGKFGEPVRNEMGWKKVELKNLGKIITGNTPPRKDKDNYSPEFIEWIKTDNIDEDKTYLTEATEYLSERGLARARYVTPGAILVACIAGSIESIGRVAIADRRVSFNQQINAIQPNVNTSPLFLYWLFKISKKYIQKHATKGMKKIITKGDFEEIAFINPPLPLQKQFVTIAEKVEVLKQKFNDNLIELENLYVSLSQKTFQGEIDLSKIHVEKVPEIQLETQGEQRESETVASNNGEKVMSKIYSESDLLKIIQSSEAKGLSFNDIISELEKNDYDEMPSYTHIKDHIFKMLDTSNTHLVQTLVEVQNESGKLEKKILLRVNI